MIRQLSLHKFTCFEDITFSPHNRLNILIGGNGTGKTHIMKVLYSFLSAKTFNRTLAEALVRNFMPLQDDPTRLVRRGRGQRRAEMRCNVGGKTQACYLISGGKARDKVGENGGIDWGVPQKTSESSESGGESQYAIYLPPKEFLSHSKGFTSLYNLRKISFEGIYSDLITYSLLPPVKGTVSRTDPTKHIKLELEKLLEGTITDEDDVFFLKHKGLGELEFPLVAEGMRKIGLLSRLTANRLLVNGSILFWDEPESNMNPWVMEQLAKILFRLATNGVQCFIATHSYLLLRLLQLEAQTQKHHENESIVRYHLFTQANLAAPVEYSWTENPVALSQTKIMEANKRLFERIMDLERIEL